MREDGANNEQLLKKIDELKKTNDILETLIDDVSENERLLIMSQHVARIGHYFLDIRTDSWSGSEALDSIFGVNTRIGRTVEFWLSMIHPDDRQMMTEYWQQTMAANESFFDKKYRIINQKTKSALWVHGLGSLTYDKEGNALEMLGTIQDVTKQEEMERRIIEISIRDPLTDVYNRRYLFEHLGKDLSKYRRDKIAFSVSILDIDHFKKINDTNGHLAGDQVLIDFTRIIQENIRPYDLLGRYGGEEFVVVTYGNMKNEAAEIMQRILELVRKAVTSYNGNDIKFTFSCGITDVSEAGHDHLTIETILSVSDKRLYTAKHSGRNRIVYSDA